MIADGADPSRRSPPPALRVVAAVAALGVAVVFLVEEPASWAALGCAWTAGAVVVATLPLLVFLVLLAAAPDALRAPLRRWTRVDVTDGGHVAAAILLAGTLFFVLGWGGLVTASATVESSTQATCRLPTDALQPASGDAILSAVTLDLIVFTLPVLFYVAFVHGLGPAAAVRALGLREDGALRAVGIGLIAAVVFLAVLLGVEAIATKLVPESYLQNDRAIDIAQSVTPLGALALAIASGLGEEVFFRGFLQPRVGLVATAVLFASAHVSYASVSEVVVVFVLALVLGFLYRRTGNLLAPIATHFAFNLLNLLAASMAR